MAFRASNDIPQIAYAQLRAVARNVRLHSLAAVARMAASGADYETLRDLYTFLRSALTQLNQLAQTPGIVAYAQQQEDDATYDVAAEYGAMVAAIDAVTDWMEANIPTSVTAVPVAQWTANGSLIATTYSAGDTAALRALLQAAADTVA